MGTNLTSAKITKRDNPLQKVLMAGSPINIAGKEPDENEIF
jgi:hypothetical protein